MGNTKQTSNGDKISTEEKIFDSIEKKQYQLTDDVDNDFIADTQITDGDGDILGLIKTEPSNLNLGNILMIAGFGFFISLIGFLLWSLIMPSFLSIFGLILMLGLTVALFFQGNKVRGEERSFWIEVKNQLRYKLQNKDINYLNSLRKETQITPVARQEIDRQAFLKMQQEYNKYKLSDIDKKNNGLL